MAKKGTAPPLDALRRTMAAVASRTGGQIPKGSYPSRLQRAHDLARAQTAPVGGRTNTSR